MTETNPQTKEELKQALYDALQEPTFDAANAKKLLKKLQKICGKHPFTVDLPEGTADYDIMDQTVLYGTLPAVKWAIRNKIMGPEDVNYSRYSTTALMEESDEDITRYLLKKFGLSLAEVPWGDIPEDGQELVQKILPEYRDDYDPLSSSKYDVLADTLYPISLQNGHAMPDDLPPHSVYYVTATVPFPGKARDADNLLLPGVQKLASVAVAAVNLSRGEVASDPAIYTRSFIAALKPKTLQKLGLDKEMFHLVPVTEPRLFINAKPVSVLVEPKRLMLVYSEFEKKILREKLETSTKDCKKLLVDEMCAYVFEQYEDKLKQLPPAKQLELKKNVRDQLNAQEGWNWIDERDLDDLGYETFEASNAF